MTAVSVTIHHLFCNGPSCYKRFKTPEGMDHWAKPPELRKLAAKEGWTHVPFRIGRKRFDQDYCPDHKPEPAPEGTPR